jgi:hypothetical protein
LVIAGVRSEQCSQTFRRNARHGRRGVRHHDECVIAEQQFHELHIVDGAVGCLIVRNGIQRHVDIEFSGAQSFKTARCAGHADLDVDIGLLRRVGRFGGFQHRRHDARTIDGDGVRFLRMDWRTGVGGA